MAPLARFSGQRLREARMARMRTAVGLARDIGVSPAALTKYETKGSTPSPLVLGRIVSTLSLPHAYFFNPPVEEDPAPFMMRSLASSTKGAREAARVKTNWIRQTLSYVTRWVQLPGANLPDLFQGVDPRVLREDDIEDAALRLRRFWDLGDGPILDLTGLVESNGVIVSRFPFGADKLDAFSKWAPEAPIVADNTEKCTAVRLRFDIAHELGHLVLHRHVPNETARRRDVHKVMEKQAHRFAGSFLFPASSFTGEVYTVSIRGLVDLKRRWGMAASAMIYRAHDLKMINDHQKQYAFKAMSIAGYRNSEPLDDELPVEKPGLLASAFHALLDRGYSPSDIMAELKLAADDVEAITGLPEGSLREERSARNEGAKVILLKDRR